LLALRDFARISALSGLKMKSSFSVDLLLSSKFSKSKLCAFVILQEKKHKRKTIFFILKDIKCLPNKKYKKSNALSMFLFVQYYFEKLVNF